MAKTKTSTTTKTEIKFPDRYNIVFYNDDFTPMDFVIQLLIEVFDRSIEEAKNITIQIHEDGSGIAGTYFHELAEQKYQESTIITRHNGHPLRIAMEKMS